jgi:hypothetical protein
MGTEARVLTRANAEELTQWCGGLPVVEHDALDHEKTFPAINVPYGDGAKRASLGDTIVRMHDGSFEVFKV